MQSLNHIDELVTAANAAGLDGLDFLAEFDRATLAREYNGIGPEWAGEKIRAKVTQHLGLFEPAALIHDLRNYESDGTRKAFNYANFEFLGNCLKIANRTYPWYSWRRYRAYAAAHAMFDFVSGPGGWTAWLECYTKNKK